MAARRPLLATIVAAAVAFGAIGPVAAASAELRVVFAAGCHSGYRFAASGAVTASLERCLPRASGAPASSRAWIAGRGMHFAITSGIWAGYLVPETPRSYVAGIVGSFPLPAGERRSFPVGTYVGYVFDAGYRTRNEATRTFLARASGAPVSRHAVINGQAYLHASAGIFAGQWVKAGATRSGGPLMEYGPNPPACRYDDVTTPHAHLNEWPRTLLDTIYRVGPGYAPGDLVDTSASGLNGGYRLRRLVIADLKAMISAARAAAVPLQTVSAYRSFATQQQTFDHWVSVSGYQQALLVSARAGHSEHQLGTTLDFTSLGGAAPWAYADWATTAAGKWMAANAWRYGFVMSYPRGKQAITCYSYEPWHYRYVGRTMAAHVTASGLTLREYLWRMGSGA